MDNIMTDKNTVEIELEFNEEELKSLNKIKIQMGFNTLEETVNEIIKQFTIRDVNDYVEEMKLKNKEK